MFLSLTPSLLFIKILLYDQSPYYTAWCSYYTKTEKEINV